jgi:c-di-GMP-related signal transduction protein
MNGYYIHKDPILDRRKSIIGYQLYFREAIRAENGLKWPVLPVDGRVIEAVAQGGGLEKLTGSKSAFFDANLGMLDLDILRTLPKGTVLQVTERDGLDKDVIIKSGVLRKQGYRIAVAHSGNGMGILPLYQSADLVRIDSLSFDPNQLSQVVAMFQKLPVKLAAYNVQDRAAHDYCEQLGFELFEGPFFIQPAEGAEPISSSQTLLMQLSNDLRANKDVTHIEKLFKNGPKLAFGLLKLINSAFFGVAQKITSIRHAITLLGYENLQKWVVLLLFTVDRRDEKVNPLIERAIVRGKVMEVLANQAGEKSVVDSAFITGMLSLINVLFNVSASEVTEKMNLAQEIQDALLKREGLLGTLLNLVEKMDKQEYESADGELGILGLTRSDLLSAETDAIVESQLFLGAGIA